jgi:uncharacterized phage infection (PIP) family protein YhgE
MFHHAMQIINERFDQIMTNVQIDDTLVASAVQAIEDTSGALNSLSQAVEAFLSANPSLPPSTHLDALNVAQSDAATALSTAGTAATDLANATNPAVTPQPVTPAPVTPVDPTAGGTPAPVDPTQPAPVDPTVPVSDPTAPTSDPTAPVDPTAPADGGTPTV